MKAFTAAAACVLLAACSLNPTAPDISFRVIGQATIPMALDLRQPQSAVAVIRDAAEWADFLLRSGLQAPSGRPDDPIPRIDFSTEMSVVLLLGARPTSGYAIRIDQIARRGAAIVMSATEAVSCETVLPVVTYPLTAVAVIRSDREVIIEWSRETCQ